jgi:hypothetical protein
LRWVGLATVSIALCLTLYAVPARADDDAPRPAPRTAVTIGDASVVLIATMDRLYAFVDRIEDNAPVEDAALEIDTSEGGSITMNRAPINMNKATAGMFVGPLDRRGHMQDAFLVTLHSAIADGQEPAEIIYTDVVPPVGIAPMAGIGSKVAVAVVSGAIGAIASVLVMLWLRGARRRVATAPVRTAQTV